MLPVDLRIFGKACRVRIWCALRRSGPRRRRIWTRSNGCVTVPYCDGRMNSANPNQRFYREIVAWKYVSHPNVLPFLGVSETLFSFCIISPWLRNGNIVEYIQKHREANRLHLVSDRHNPNTGKDSKIPPSVACTGCQRSRVPTLIKYST